MSLQAQVTFDRILQPTASRRTGSVFGHVFNQRYSPLTQITPANAKNLQLQWVWQAAVAREVRSHALVVDGVLYTVQAPNDVVALDAVTGRVFWTLRINLRPMREPVVVA